MTHELRLPTVATGGRYGAMEGLRGFAVILVFFVHFMAPVARDIYHHPELTLANADSPLFAFFYYLMMSHHGVDIFFLLSGFLMVRLIQKNRPLRYGSFLLDRFYRIYPAFIVALIVATGVFSFHFGWFPFDPSTFLLNGLLLQGIQGLGIKNYHIVTWSLTYELLFYLTIPVLLRLVPATALRGASVLLIGVGFVVLPGDYIRFEGFLFGALIASFNDEQLRGWASRLSDYPIVAAYVLLGVAKVYWASNLNWYAGFLIVAGLLFVNACYGSGWLNVVLNMRWLRQLGNVSYSFYLYHTIALPLTFNHLVIPLLVGRLHPLTTTLVAFLLTFSLSVVLALASFYLLEKPYFDYKARTRTQRVPGVV